MNPALDLFALNDPLSPISKETNMVTWNDDSAKKFLESAKRMTLSASYSPQFYATLSTAADALLGRRVRLRKCMLQDGSPLRDTHPVGSSPGNAIDGDVFSIDPRPVKAGKDSIWIGIRIDHPQSSMAYAEIYDIDLL